jgi:hypothetical protein
MKLNLTIDCTPEEARKFLGLPDVVPVQEALMAELEAKMREALRSMAPEEMVKLWMPAAMEGWGNMQKAFFTHVKEQP